MASYDVANNSARPTVRTAKAWPVARCQLSKVHWRRLSDVVSGLAGEYGKVAARVNKGLTLVHLSPQRKHFWWDNAG